MRSFPVISVLLAAVIIGGQFSLHGIEQNKRLLNIAKDQHELSQKISNQLHRMKLQADWTPELSAQLVTRLHLLHYNHQRLLHLSEKDKNLHLLYMALSDDVRVIVETGFRLLGRP